jgi:hypothetical protein
VSSANGDAVLHSSAPLRAGLHVFTCEYRTAGFPALAKFAVDAKTPDWKTNLSPYEWTSACPSWTPLVVYLNLPVATVVQIRFGNWQGTMAQNQLLVRSLRSRPISFGDMSGKTWMPKDAFDYGQPGYLPPNWCWGYAAGTADQESLQPNRSFRSGKHILRMVGDGTKGRIVRYRTLPLPEGGNIRFTVWARADEPTDIGLHIVQDGWGKRAEKHHTVTAAWKQYAVEWAPPAKREKDWFFLRIDGPKGTTPVEIAEPQLVWQGPAPAEAKDPHQAAIERGWQGAPGPNLIYNPDFELGGVGYFYDFSWPKTYDNYASIRQARPAEILEGEGVDGGDCILLQGASARAYCFPVTVGQTYTVSADFRAAPGQQSAECSVLSFDTEWRCALWTKATKIPGDRWQRYHWTFTWKNDNIQKRGYVNFGGRGVMVDRVQVVTGNAAEYQPPPVMLGLTYDRWPYFVRGRDQARAQLRIVPGVLGPGTTDVTVVANDAWGREVWKREMQAPLDRKTTLPIDLPTDRLGIFHLDLKATISGKTAGIGIGRYGILDKPYLQPTVPGKPGLAGVCQESFNFPTWLCEDHADILTDTGVRLNRFFASVPPDLPDPIPADWAADLRAKCEPFRKAGIDVMPCVGLIPGSAGKAAGTIDPARPEDLAAYGKALKQYVEALKPQVRYWEIFNEPNLWRVSSGPNAGKRTMYPTKYLEFQKVAYATIKGIDPNLHVVCNALNNVDFRWIDEWMKAGGGTYMDIFSFHPYGVTDFAEQGAKLHETLASFGFKGPAVNSEKYYGANMFYDRAGHEETRRGYYLPHEGELKTAGRSIQHFVSSCAVGVPVCFFNPSQTLSRRGPGNELFLYDFFAAYSAAIRLVVPAGAGEKLDLGPSVSAILFEKAPGGPLAVVWTPQLNVEGTLKPAGEFTAYDIMGNQIKPGDLENGVRLAPDPSYIRFAPGTSVASIRRRLAEAETLGLGAPFKVEVGLVGPQTLGARVTSLHHRPIDGKVRLVKLPKGWQGESSELPFSDLGPGQTALIEFPLQGAELQSLSTYPVAVVAEHGEDFVRCETVLRPLVARPIGGVKADGNLDEWNNAEWLALGENQLSKDFDPKHPHKGATDLSARLALGWRTDGLAMALVVTDDHLKTGESAPLAWQGDSVQVYLDPRNDATASDAHSSDNVEYLLSRLGDTSWAWLIKGADGNYKGAANRTDGLNDSDVQLAIVRHGTETTYEAFFPQQKCLPDAILAAGRSLGFAILINDNDGTGRKQGITLTPPGTEPYGNANQFADLLLAPPK